MTLSEEQRTKIQQTVLSRNDVPRVDHVNFAVNVGTRVPTDIRVVEVPQTLIDIYPEWRGDEYFVVNDELVVLNNSHTIVAVVPTGGSEVRTEGRATSGVGSLEEIRQVQQVLIRDGYYHGQVDGVLGPEMKEALIRFQRSQGLSATGQIDSATLSKVQVSERSSSRQEDRSSQESKSSTVGRGNDVDQSHQSRDVNQSSRSRTEVNKSQQSNDTNRNGAEQSRQSRDVNDRGANDRGAQGPRESRDLNNGQKATGNEAGPSTVGQGGNRGKDQPGPGSIQRQPTSGGTPRNKQNEPR